jgi:ribose/xylose/arabinose/galactoside ABC-type transport system permease subunit
VVIGGTSLLGGRFSILMSVLGAIIIQAMNTGILISGFPPEYNLIVKAGVIIMILLAQSASLGAFVIFRRTPKPVETKAEAQ